MWPGVAEVSKVVQFPAKVPESAPDEAQSAFEAYQRAKAAFDQSGDYIDALAAGKAWRRFIELFIPDAEK
jgi:hypothetical protein